MYTDSSKGQSLFGDNNTDILCRQKWVALLPVLLFTHDDRKKDKIMQ